MRGETSREQNQQRSGAQSQGSKKKLQQRKEATRSSGSSANENGRVGQRPYARGRSYSEDHYKE